MDNSFPSLGCDDYYGDYRIGTPIFLSTLCLPFPPLRACILTSSSRQRTYPEPQKPCATPVIYPRTSLTNDYLSIQHALSNLSEKEKAAVLKEMFVRDVKTVGLVFVVMLGLAAFIVWVVIKKRAAQAKRLALVKGMVDEEHGCEEKIRTGWGF